MKRACAMIVSALATLAFAGLVCAAEPYATDTHPPIIEEQPAVKADTGAKAEKKAKKKRKKAAKKAKKRMKEQTGMTTAPNETAPAPNTTGTPAQPPR